MKISGLTLTISLKEFCDRVLRLLRSRVPSFVTISSVTINKDLISVNGAVSKLGERTFSTTFALQYDENLSIILKLKSATVSKTWMIPGTDFAIVNAALANSIPDSPGVSYSWWDERLNISLPDLLSTKGIDLDGRIVQLLCAPEIKIVIA